MGSSNLASHIGSGRVETTHTNLCLLIHKTASHSASNSRNTARQLLMYKCTTTTNACAAYIYIYIYISPIGVLRHLCLQCCGRKSVCLHDVICVFSHQTTRSSNTPTTCTSTAFEGITSAVSLALTTLPWRYLLLYIPCKTSHTSCQDCSEYGV